MFFIYILSGVRLGGGHFLIYLLCIEWSCGLTVDPFLFWRLMAVGIFVLHSIITCRESDSLVMVWESWNNGMCIISWYVFISMRFALGLKFTQIYSGRPIWQHVKIVVGTYICLYLIDGKALPEPMVSQSTAACLCWQNVIHLRFVSFI